MADKKKVLRDTQPRANLINTLLARQLGVANDDKSIGYKDETGVMSFYTPEGGNATFNALAITGLGESGFLSVDSNGNIGASTIEGVSSTWLDPVINFYDNSSALPTAPIDGDRYIAESTANTWTKDYVYQWDDANTAWVETQVSQEGVMVYIMDLDDVYYFTGAMWTLWSSGVVAFLGLNDTPSSYSGQNGKYVRVKATADGLEFHELTEFTYTNATAMPEQVGGYETGTTFTAQTLKQIFDGLLYPYQYPAFSSFIFSGWSTTLEVGDSTPSNPTATWVTNNDENVNTNSIDIDDVTSATNIITGTADDGTQALTYGSITKNTPISNVFRITGTNSKSQDFTKDYTVNWYWRIYAGTSSNTSLTESQIEALTDYTSLANSFERTYSLSANNYKYICYPTSMGLANSFIDADTGFAVAMESPVITSVTNSFGQTTNYYVYRSTNPLVAAVNIIVS